MLANKEIIVGITGGIAAYKTAELVRELSKRGANVHVVMTKNAMEFVTPLTFQTLSGNPVVHEMFELFAGSKIGHIALSDIADQMVIVPATANIIGKIANGIADDFLTTMVMATTVPILFVPSMNTKMWGSPMVQNNVARLKDAGYEFMEPASGDLACGTSGKGRMPPVEEVVEMMEDIFTEKDLVGERIMVTAGPTTEYIDPVRCITNKSSGKMGYSVAKIARRRGAEVVLITGKTYIPPPREDVRTIEVETACEMRDAVMAHFRECSVVIKAAAVADFKCKDENCQKIKKKDGTDCMTLELEKNPDILGELGKLKEHRVLIGFAAETENLFEHAADKLKRKNLDIIIANDVAKVGIGFGSDNNEVTIIEASGSAKHIPVLSKDEIAHIILDAAKKALKKKKRVEDDWY
ncbi:bifunctional phosphopantothenoylcysteine decarboxylase/phosphopantothenate--cysteine ligase CoaBC [Syntrophorhabdus aromaticivorans]|jgi:phosphopantothenoylcysteine decarboxylase/phosphopantothenate--cysteine ligase|uniref:Coenzyme A biosynthesis bifunctional protein CoaBC n=1 Tax=Syntrophorhabdus aromaticivorans TaxID=328301 RepID=A0A351TZF2_9BACT|nr:bifunctional phosphopantothenoylcysteine decarboxylase/phosphopantothenate--cysteine ligase CoaBC [Syntrophorhabdus aromaticivorans]NLW35044.1 bifunctional phosphopantothenoylcysteine decarboxylase/phosphopantothenate--cysteine ligase CoaBC [Syntrophorhabdus aromaticivorans]HBA53083.1 bifunctional phosphopantothenoylcysteine decarboxylase/phosphopantothenate--cysteine ligase CoaBC [Syntrophorhabdus aromaticivorans]